MVSVVNRFLLILVAFIGCLSLNAQTVSNVSATQQGNELLVSYSLATDTPCEVSLFVSLNGGKSWIGPLMHVSGDVGKNISAGSNVIRWQVLEEQEQLVGSGIHFKVVAIRAGHNASGMSWQLNGRSMINTPKVNGTAPDEGTVTVDIWVDPNGNVTKAVANAAKSTTSNGSLFVMAEDAARKVKFSSSPVYEMQKGMIKITFKLR